MQLRTREDRERTVRYIEKKELVNSKITKSFQILYEAVWSGGFRPTPLVYSQSKTLTKKIGIQEVFFAGIWGGDWERNVFHHALYFENREEVKRWVVYRQG